MKNKARNDILLAASILLIAVSAFLLFLLFAKEGSTVVITVNGEEFGKYPLSEDKIITVDNGFGYNLVIIEGGEVTVGEADCPDGICVKHRKIKNEGETIVCLPHKLVVSVEGEGDKAPDLVS